MGVDISLVAEPPKGLFGPRRFDLEGVGEALLREAPLPEPLDRLSVVFPPDNGVMFARPISLEEDIRFELLEDGRLVVSAKTSSVGPGYHAWLIEALDAAADLLGFEWQETGEHFDETGYFADRDFERLQDEFARFFEALSAFVEEQSKEDGRNLKLAVEVDFRPVSLPGQVVTQRGWRDAAFFAGGTRGSPAQYYPWWEEAVEGPVALALAEAHLWMLFPWRAPLQERERQVGEVARDLLMAVRPLPGEWPAILGEVSDVLSADGFRAPRPQGIGYLRGEMDRWLPGDWSVRLPGWFEAGFERDGTIAAFWSDEITVRISSFTPSPERTVDLDAEFAEMEGSVRQLTERAAHAGSNFEKPDESWSERRQFEGKVATRAGVAIVTINYQSSDLDDRAAEIFLSVAPPAEIVDRGGSDDQ